MTPTPVSTTTTPGAGPAAVAPAASHAPTSPAEADAVVDDHAASPFERILSSRRGAAHPGGSERPPDDHTRGAPGAGHGAVPGLPTTPSDLSSNAGSDREASLGAKARGSLSLDAGNTGGRDVTGGGDVTSLSDLTVNERVARDPEGPPGADGVPRADGTVGEGGTPVDATSAHGTSATVVADATIASVDPTSRVGPTLVAGLGASGTAAISSGTLAAMSPGNGKPLSLPTSSPGVGSAPSPPERQGAVPAAAGAPGVASSGAGAASPRAPTAGVAVPGTTSFASSATGGLAPTALPDSVASARADAGGGRSAEDVGLDTAGLATNISGVLTRGDGNYSVVLNLHPPELGQVQARISLRGDLLQVDLSPEHAATRDALESALPALRDHLAQGGVEVDVTLGDPGAAHQGATAGDRSGQGSDRAGAPVADEANAANPAPGATTAAASGSPPGEADHLHLVL